MNNPLIITDEQGEPIYSCNSLPKLLTLEDSLRVGMRLIELGEVRWMPGGKNAYPSLFITQAGLYEALSCIGAREAKALRYIITHGVVTSRMLRGKVLFRAKDVAICFGYANPDKAIEKYCRFCSAGYIGKKDVERLAANSELVNAGSIKAWINSRIRN